MGSFSDLYNSSYCRLCCEDSNQTGIFIFKSGPPLENVSLSINKYLPVKVENDGKLPQTICSSCHIQLHATISFFDRVAEGQKKLLRLAFPETVTTEKQPEFNNDCSLSLSSGQEKKSHHKRGRGRPKKEVPSTATSPVIEVVQPPDLRPDSEEEVGKSKRKRKLPSRFSSTLQGKELEEVYRDVGLPEEESTHVSSHVDPLIIGKVESVKGVDLGDVMVSQTPEEVNRKQTKYRCDTCNKIFSQEPKFLEHQALHANEPCTPSTSSQLVSPGANKKDHNEKKEGSTHDCDLCDKKFKHISSLSYHKETEHNDGRRYVCNKCPRSFKHRQLLRRHQIVHSSLRLYNCEDCNASFKTKGNLLNHSTIHTGQKKYFCELCGQLFAHKTSLNLHTRWHIGERPFECHVCHKKFTQKGNLQEHIRIHTGEKPFACHLCNRRFTTSSQCKLHIKRHSGERPWYCSACGKSFLSKSTYLCHVRRHKGEKPFDCKHCGRNFPEGWALKKHMRTHTGEKPYTCPICGKAFADCSNLTKHRKCHYKGKLDDGEPEQIVYLSYTDPMDPSSEVSEKFVIENKTEEGVNGEMMIQVMDEMGNPLKFTFQDGTQLQVTTRDGKSLEVRTADGQTIPVKLTTDSGEAILPELTPVVIPAMDESLVDIGTIELVTNEEEAQSLTLPQDFLQIS